MGNTYAARRDDHEDVEAVNYVPQPMDIQQYAQDTWASETTKAIEMRQAYDAVREIGYRYIRQTRGDHYSCIRSSLYLVLINQIEYMGTIHRIEELASMYLGRFRLAPFNTWSFAGRLTVPTGQSVLGTINNCLDKLITIWKNCVNAADKLSSEDTLRAFIEQDELNDIHIMEAIKILMVMNMMDLQERRNIGDIYLPAFADVSLGRDSSSSPEAFFNNVIDKVGGDIANEEIDLCLVAYTLGVTIQVFDLGKSLNSPDFIAHYCAEMDADEMNRDRPVVQLITESAVHYNILEQ